MKQLFDLIPAEGVKILLVLFLSFLVGLEREEHKAASESYSFGGVRTFPLIGLTGYAMALLTNGQFMPMAVGFAVVGAFLWLSYRYKLSLQGASSPSGVTSEISALITYLVGSLVFSGYFWIATTITVASMLLLELKEYLEGLSKRVPPDQILTFTKFLLLTAVILPILPNKEFSSFQINPFKTWLVVVAVSGISYGSYVLLALTKSKSSILLSAVLGGLYSSTVTTVALAKRADREQRPHLFSGGILIASGVMYLRLICLVAIFNRQLAESLVVPCALLSGAALAMGWLWARVPDGPSDEVKQEFQPKNPLELRSALLFAALFLGVVVVTRLVTNRLGSSGVYGLAAVTGVTDVDPFILGLTQSAGSLITFSVAASSILVAAASNNLIKGMYAYGFADRKTGKQALILLSGLAVLGVVPLLWLQRVGR